jgi:CBS domain-containing protein
MKVRDLMVKDVRMCRQYDTLDTAAMIMWEKDCGFVPVVDESLRVIGVITDRDICMAAYTQGVSLKDLQVSRAMSKQAFSCRPEDDLAAAEKIMLQNHVRRLPVIDDQGRLAGIISLNDFAQEAETERRANATRRISDLEIAQLLAAVCAPRPQAARA